MNIAFFDFDGTITQRDSFFIFIQFLVGKRRFYLGMLQNVHFLLGYMLGFLSNTEAKEKITIYFLKGMSEDLLLQRCREMLPYLERIVKKGALQRIEWHKKQRDKIAIVSASFSCYLIPFAEKIGIDCLATELEVKKHMLTGRFSTPNCYGKEKVRRISKYYDLRQYDNIYVYGDSRGDKEMLEIATHRFYKYFN